MDAEQMVLLRAQLAQAQEQYETALIGQITSQVIKAVEDKIDDSLAAGEDRFAIRVRDEVLEQANRKIRETVEEHLGNLPPTLDLDDVRQEVSRAIRRALADCEVHVSAELMLD